MQFTHLRRVEIYVRMRTKCESMYARAYACTCTHVHHHTYANMENTFRGILSDVEPRVRDARNRDLGQRMN